MARTKGAVNVEKRYDIDKMCKIIRKYTDNTQCPILKEVCFENEWNYIYFLQLQRENEKLAYESRRLLEKKEISLEKALYAGANNSAFMFSLKQLGWKDNPEPIVVNNTINNNQGGNRSDALKKMSTETLEELENIYNQIDEEEKKQKDD